MKEFKKYIERICEKRKERNKYNQKLIVMRRDDDNEIVGYAVNLSQAMQILKDKIVKGELADAVKLFSVKVGMGNIEKYIVTVQVE